MARSANIVLLLSFLWFFSSVSLYSQSEQYHIEHLTPQDGLSHGCIGPALEDSRGFLWIGTRAGLNRYDGYTIREYTSDPENPHSISANSIGAIYEDPADSGKVLWIGTWVGGLSKFDLETEQFTNYKNDPNDPATLSDNDVTWIHKSSPGCYLIGTADGGLNIFDRANGTFTSYQHEADNRRSLSCNRIWQICSDRQGNSWIATIMGLNRLPPANSAEGNFPANGPSKNGQIHFVRYDHDEDDSTSLPANLVYCVHEDRQGTLWVGTEAGLRIYDRPTDSFRRHRFTAGYSYELDHGLIFFISEDAAGNLWIAMHQDSRAHIDGGGLFKINPRRTSFSRYRHDPKNPNSLSAQNLSFVIQDRSGILWAGAFCTGVDKLIPVRRQFQHFTHIPGDSTSLSSNHVRDFYEDPQGVLWVATRDGGLNRFDREQKRFTSYRHPYFSADLWSICPSRSGAVWYCWGNFLMKFNPQNKRTTIYHGNSKLSYFAGIPAVQEKLKPLFDRITVRRRLIAAITGVGDGQHLTRKFRLKDSTQVLIVAQGDGSLEELVDYGWLMKDHAAEPFWRMEANHTKYAFGARRNRIQICTQTLPPGSYQLFYRSNEQHSAAGWVEPAPDLPELWGISLYSLSTRERREIDPLLLPDCFATNLDEMVDNFDDQFLLIICKDRTGVLWCLIPDFAAGGGQLYQFDEQRRRFSKYEIAANPRISADVDWIHEDRAGDLWFATLRNGVVKRIGSGGGQPPGAADKFVRYKNIAGDPRSLSSDRIYQIYEDRRGFLWFGTDNGLNKFDPLTERFIHYLKKDGLASNRAWGMVEDDHGNLWMRTWPGLARFNPDTEIFRNFDEHDGLPEMGDSGYLGFYKTSHGEIYGVSLRGFFVFHPDSLTDNTHVPPIVLTDFRLFNQSVLPRKDSPLQQSISVAREIRLSHDQDVFSFEFAALDFTCPEKNRYAYIMEGVNPDWVYTDASRRFATSTKLDPREYTFRVKGSNNDGVWNEEGTSVRVIIMPAFWQRRWFQLVLGLVVMGGIIGLVHYLSTRKLQQRLSVLEQQRAMEKEWTRISSDMHDEVGASLTHIAITSELLKKSLNLTQKNEAQDYVEDISRTAREVIDHIGEIIWAINPRNDSLDNLIAYIRQYAGNFFEASPIRCRYDLPEHLPPQTLTSEARRNLFLVTKEALNNVLKHAAAKEVQIKMALPGDDLELIIADNGKGFCQQEVSRFGNGLKNMKKRTEDIGGQFEIFSRQGEGTVIKIGLRLVSLK